MNIFFSLEIGNAARIRIIVFLEHFCSSRVLMCNSTMGARDSPHRKVNSKDQAPPQIIPESVQNLRDEDFCIHSVISALVGSTVHP